MTSDHDSELIPNQPIRRLTAPLAQFLHVEAASGVVLAVCTLLALVLANSPLSDAYLSIWKTPVTFGFGGFVFDHSLKHWINDGLMALFFFVIGLEVKRELVLGELKDMRSAALPLFAAIGGMVVPAGIYLALLRGQPGQDGWGIPMATDIAFVIGCMALMGSRVPNSLRILILSLAIADDIGAILVIAIGYTDDIDTTALMIGLAMLGVVLLAARLGVRSFLIYAGLGFICWLAFHESGIHATIAGVALGLMTPSRPLIPESGMGKLMARVSETFHGDGFGALPHRAQKLRELQWATRESVSPLEFLEGNLHPWVGFLIMPVFALANAGVPFSFDDFGDPVALAVVAGLVVGKPVGIVAFSWVAVRLRIATLPPSVSWGSLLGGGCLAGIGFTMALFISGLALEGDILNAAKVGVLGASTIAALFGVTILLFVSRNPSQDSATTSP